MKLHVLGMYGPYPAPGGATSGYLLRSGDTAVQLDLGAGTLAPLTALYPPEQLTALVFSHWHSDHCSDALPLLYRLQALQADLDVYGPADAASPVRAALAADARIRLHTIAPGDRLTLGGMALQVYQARHPVPAVMLRLSDGDSTLCYTGDTNTVEALDAFAENADLLLADGLFLQSQWSEAKPHLSALQCGELAERCGARRLLVTHQSPENDPQAILREARQVFPGAQLAACGQCIAL